MEVFSVRHGVHSFELIDLSSLKLLNVNFMHIWHIGPSNGKIHSSLEFFSLPSLPLIEFHVNKLKKVNNKVYLQFIEFGLQFIKKVDLG